MDLFAEIKSSFSGEVLSDPETLLRFSHDTSIFEIKPLAVLVPKTIKELQGIVRYVGAKKKELPDLSITARSGGTDMSGGAINDSLIVDFSKHLNKIGQVFEDGTRVQPGAYFRDFDRKTKRKGLFLPSYPASREICALGGMIANNAGGEKTLSVGKTIDYVKNLKMLLSDGEVYSFGPLSMADLNKKLHLKGFEGDIYRQIFKIVNENYDLIKSAKPKVSKNSTGYNIWDVWDQEVFDLSKLFVGAQGTLGLNVEATMKLAPIKKESGLLVIYLDDLKVLPQIINEVLTYNPDSFEAFDDHTLNLALTFMPQFIQKMGLEKSVEMGIQFLPTLFSFYTEGLPKFTMLVEFSSDNVVEVREKINQLNLGLAKYPIKTAVAASKEEAESYWLIRHESFNLLRNNVKDKHAAPFIDDFIVKPEYLVDFFPQLTAILKRHQIEFTIAGHMGDGNFHIIPLMDLRDHTDRDKIPVVENEVNDLVLKYHGSISAEHNDGLIRGHYLHQMYGDRIFAIFKHIKRLFDPLDIFNPHKKVDADLSFSLAHVRSQF